MLKELTQWSVDVVDRCNHVKVLNVRQSTHHALSFLVAQHGSVDVVNDEEDVQRWDGLHLFLNQVDRLVRVAGDGGRHLQQIRPHRVENVFDGETREESVDDDDVLVRQLLLVERLQQVALGAESVQQNRVAFVEQRQPLVEVRLVILVERLHSLRVFLAQRHVRQQFNQLIVWQARILQAVQRVVGRFGLRGGRGEVIVGLQEELILAFVPAAPSNG